MTHPHRALAAVFALSLAAGAALTVAAASPSVPADAFSDLRWRLVGPLRAGWATCVAGVPQQPETFYFGGADGGVWKTSDAGRTWKPLFDHQTSASIGALAVAPSDPSVLYAGTGQVTTRWDVASGDGVYRSRDGGKSWERRGLADSRHIGRILVDPANPDVVLVAALGHLFGPNPERGVFRSTDGGATWEKVLFLDPDTGAVDLAADPSAPEVVFAALWQARRYPWQAYFTPMTGPGSGIWKSADGGKSWTRLTGHGLPEAPAGRIGLAVAPGSGGTRVYATIDGEGIAGLYRSDDAGATWQRVNPTAGLASGYFSMLAVDPHDADTVYVMGQSIRRSTDGGKSFGFFRGAPGGDDYHDLWIDPVHPGRMITGADQGAVITVNGGESWSSWYNQPTGQFYHLATDDRFPYWIYSGQQDSGTVAVASRSDYGQLTFRDWHPVGADERDYDVPYPGNADLVFGSGLGGRLTRWDAATGQVRNVSPWPVSSYGQRPTTVRYRTTWITPIAISEPPPHALYQGAQVLFRSLDRGQSWEEVSPDLTGAVPGTAGCDGDVPIDRARACGYGTIFAIAPSRLDPHLIWVGTDDGLIHLTHDGGESWQDVTPPGLAPWSRVASIDASPHDPPTAYAAVDLHRLDDLRPLVYVTHDYGKSWRQASAGLPADAAVFVVRQDPLAPSLLFAGTRRGAFVSFDDGAGWLPLQLGLPTTGVNDLIVHGDDLVAATEGRAIWVLDDYSPLRQLAGSTPAAAPLLFPPAVAYRLRGNMNRDTPLPADEPTAPNPPAGAVLDYLLPAGLSAPVRLEIADAAGQVVRRFASDETPARPPARQYFGDAWLQPPAALPARPGHNRFVWDLRFPRPPAIDYDYSIAAVPGADTPEVPQGLLVPPGRYEVRLTVGSRTLAQPLAVELDPRVRLYDEDLAAQVELYRSVAEALGRVTATHAEVEVLDQRLEKLDQALAARPGGAKAKATVEKVAAVANRFRLGPQDDNLETIGGVLSALATDLEGADATPTQPQRQVFELYRQRLDAALAHWKSFLAGPVHELDAHARKTGLPPVLP